MDDNDVCPLCCEELDMSDRQFYPCKCGYQVCMWCWHRIRESESGLCPACRTPYGDDPHEFSAVDMEEVIKANKEKAAAEKRERERLRQAAAASSGYGSSVNNIGNMHIGGGSDGDLAVAMGGGYGAGSGGGRGQLEPPKDRNQLANMRVIRRNLVYAVGLPPSLATEETLRKPEYFGQYGKISKIVINRNHNGNGDPRRASASAYVTFAQKEDTLACILALDGFYHEGRNVRASYGTSKYCSAFIKNVRCNNPDCTYLHCMGDAEDTFTKQEIQAGYVTSGRDVLAKQQQLAAAAQSSSSGGGGTRRRVGGGGPSGSGKVPSSPVFPPPTFDEPPKPSTTTLVGSAPISGQHSPPNRSVSAGVTGFSTVTAAGAPSAASIAAGKVTRSVSMSGTAKPPAGGVIVGVPSVPPAIAGLAVSGGARGSKGIASGTSGAGLPSAVGQKKVIGNEGPPPQGSLLNGGGVGVPNVGPAAAAGPLPATAASVVAGVRSSSSGNTVQPPAHTTLTSLTPLKRGLSVPSKHIPGSNAIGTKSSGASDAGVDSVHLPQNMPVPKGLTPAEQAALLEQRKEAMAALARQQREMAMKLTALRGGGNAVAIGAPTMSGAGVIGGAVIGAAGSSSGQGLGVVGGGASGVIIGGNPSSQLGSIGGVSANAANGGLGGPTIVGGVGSIGVGAQGRRDGNFEGNALAPSSLSLLGNANDKWGGSAESQGGSDIFGVSGGGLWGNDASGPSSAPAHVGNLHNAGSSISPIGAVGGNAIGGEIGRGRVGGQGVNSAVGGGSLIGNNPFASGSGGYNSGSSALASMLGVELPTGSGSLRESSSLWDSSSAQPSIGANNSSPAPIGTGSRATGGIIIGGGPSAGGPGGVPIGGFPGSNSGATTVGSNTSDIALLQSLLPGVHITSGNAQQPAAPSGGSGGVIGGGGWGSTAGIPPQQQQQGGVGIGGLNLSQSQPQPQPQQHQGGGGGDTWGGAGLYSQAPGGPSPAGPQQQQQQRQTSIW